MSDHYHKNTNFTWNKQRTIGKKLRSTTTTSQETLTARSGTRWTRRRSKCVNQSSCTTKFRGKQRSREASSRHLSDGSTSTRETNTQGAESHNEEGIACARAFQRDATVGNSQIMVIIPCDGWNLRSCRTGGIFDVSRAHFMPTADGDLYIELPDEAKEPLNRRVCGFRDASRIWMRDWLNFLKSEGSAVGKQILRCSSTHSDTQEKQSCDDANVLQQERIDHILAKVLASKYNVREIH